MILNETNKILIWK